MMPPQQRPITHQVQQPVPPPYLQQPQVFTGQTPTQLQGQLQAHQHLQALPQGGQPQQHEYASSSGGDQTSERRVEQQEDKLPSLKKSENNDFGANFNKSIVQQASTNGVFDVTSDFSGGLRNKPDTFPCEICNITCTCSENLKEHIAGKKHRKKLEESNQGKTVNLHGVKLVCELCRVTCDTSEVMRYHMSRKNHRKNLEKSEKLIGANPAVTTEPAETSKVIEAFQEDGKMVTSDGRPKTNRKKSGSDDDKSGSDDDVETKKHDAMASYKLQAEAKGLMVLYPKNQ